MKLRIKPGQRTGTITAPSSKSQCHRLFILAAVGKNPVEISCGRLSEDIAACIKCLRAMGAKIDEIKPGVFRVEPIKTVPAGKIHLYCGESGSVLRFLMPLCGALNLDAVFHMEGRLPQRPITELREELESNGMEIEKSGDLLICRGRLFSGSFTLSGDKSSQYFSALLMSLPLLKGSSEINIKGKIESAPYILMTEELLKSAGIKIIKTETGYIIPGEQIPSLPDKFVAEGDFSSAAFFLCAGALSDKGIRLKNLNLSSCQGDKEIIDILKRMGAGLAADEDSILVSRGELHKISLDASQIPDLVPPVAALAALTEGETVIYNAARLRFKESDRLKSTAAMLNCLGAEVQETEDGLIIKGKPELKGGTVENFHDHRISMAAAIAACGAENEVIIEGAEAIGKSYPGFRDDFFSLERE